MNLKVLFIIIIVVHPAGLHGRIWLKIFRRFEFREGFMRNEIIIIVHIDI